MATGLKLRPQTAPRRDLKATKDHSHLRPSLPSTTPPHHSVTKMYIFEYIRILSDSSTHSYFIRFKNLNIFIRTLFVSNFRRNNISYFFRIYPKVSTNLHSIHNLHVFTNKPKASSVCMLCFCVLYKLFRYSFILIFLDKSYSNTHSSHYASHLILHPNNVGRRK